MQAVWYLILWGLAFGAALGVGLISHWAHAHLSAYPDKLFDGGGASDAVLNEVFSPRHSLIGVYDEAGWWAFDSLRNYLLHAGPWVFLVVATGAFNWPARAQVVQQFCDAAPMIGLTPAFCG
ncbi:hypothetical protein [Brevundimonas aveniformis]|uniref:hypothetical protein n=1 Tax=Brevundimonas aveniformis TaxID=370977 RepID=UPI00249096FA|nr:hypothetical protein [Brevundimonas aveniformis]